MATDVGTICSEAKGGGAIYRKAQLSVRWQRLVELLATVQFGRLETLPVKRGEPVLGPSTRILHELTLGKGLPRPGSHPNQDYLLKQEILDLIACFNALGDGVVECLHVRHGLPFRLEIEDRLDAQGGLEIADLRGGTP